MEIIKLNLIPSGVNPTCHAKQYDKGRIIRFELFNGLTPYTLQSGDTVTLNLRKPDNTIIEASVTATQGNKYVDLVTTEQMCAVAGYNLGTFKIVNGETDIGTIDFIMEVGKDVLANGIPSQSVIEDLDALVAEAVEEDLGDNYYNKPQTDAKIEALIDDETSSDTKTWSSNKLVSELNNKANVIIADRSGNPINMSDSIANKLVRLLNVDLSVVQSGIGAPSPTNPRQFVPWSAFNVYHGKDQATYDTYPFALPSGSSICGGKLNALTGEFTVEWVAETTNGNNWSISSGGNAAQFGHTPCKWSAVGSEVYQKCTHWNNTIYSNDDSVVLNQNGALLLGKKFWDAVGITPTNQSVAEYFAAQALAGTPLYVCAYLKEPYTIQLTPITIETIEGDEIIWADMNANIDIKYLADTQKYIDRENSDQKKILVFGDSLWGEDRVNGVADFLKEYSGAVIYNCAVNGTMICNDSTPASAAFSGISLVHAKVTDTWTDQDTYASQVASYVATDVLPMLKALDLSTIDVVIMAYGTNDFSYNRTVAQIAAAYETAVSELLTAYPFLRVLEIAPPWKTFENGTVDGDVYVNSNGETLRDAADGIVSSAHNHHITALNMLDELPWRAETAWYYMEPDKIHPNINGNKIYAHVVNGKIRSMY